MVFAVFGPNGGQRGICGSLPVFNQVLGSRYRVSGVAALAAVFAMLWTDIASASLLGITQASGAPPDITLVGFEFDYNAGTGAFSAWSSCWTLELDGQPPFDAYGVAGSPHPFVLSATIGSNGVFQSGAFSVIADDTTLLLGGNLKQFGYEIASSGPNTALTLQFVASDLSGSLASQFGGISGIAGFNIQMTDYQGHPSSWANIVGYHRWSATADIFPVVPEPSSFLAWSLGIASICLCRRRSKRSAT